MDRPAPAAPVPSSVPSLAITILCWLWSLAVMVAYLRQHPLTFPELAWWPADWTRVMACLPGPAFLALATMAGLGLLLLLGARLSSAACLLGSLPLGLVLASLLALGVGLTVGVTRTGAATWIGLLVLPALAGIPSAPALVARMTRHPLWRHPLVGAALLLLAMIGGTTALGLLAPVTSYDDQVYHLTIPRRYVQAGTIVPLPELPPSHRPQGLHVVYAMLMAGGAGEQAIRTFSWAFGLITALSLLGALGRRWGAWPGVVAALAFYTHPQVAWLSTTAYVDLPIAWLLVTGLLLAIEAWFDAQRAAWVGLMATAAFLPAVKLSGVVLSFFLAMAGWVVWTRPRIFRSFSELRHSHQASGVPVPWPGVVAFLGAMLLVAGPWYFINWLRTGNPIYPHLGFLFSTAGCEPPTVSAFQAEFGGVFPYYYDPDILLHRFGMGRDVWALLWLPWNVTIHGHIHDQATSLMHFDGQISFLPLAFLPHLFRDFFRCAWPARGVYLLASFLFVLWGAGSHQIRFLLPTLAVVALTAGLWARRLAKERLPMGFSLLVAGLVATSFAAERSARVAPLVGGQQDHASFLSQALPFYPAYQFINQSPTLQGKVLPLFEERVYYLEKPFQWMELVPYPFLSACLAANHPKQVSNYLHRLGIDTLYISKFAFRSLPDFFDHPGYRETLRRFFAEEVEQVYEDAKGTVFRWRPPDQPLPGSP